MGRVRKTAALEELPTVGACPVDGTPVHATPAGTCCEKGHGGVDPLPTEEKTLASKLIAEMEASDKETATQKARDFVFANANAAKERPIDPRFPAMVERTFPGADWGAVFDEFEQWLELGDRRGEEAFIRLAHERGPAIVRRVFGAYTEIRLARETWEKQNDVLLGSMREQANDILQAEKQRGVRSKTITEADVEKKCAVLFGDEWEAQEIKRRKFKAVEERAKHDVEVATLRCRTLDTMMSRLR